MFHRHFGKCFADMFQIRFPVLSSMQKREKRVLLNKDLLSPLILPYLSAGSYPGLARLKACALCLVSLRSIASGNSDMLRHAESILVVNAVLCLAGYSQLALRGLKHVLKHLSLVLVEAGAAGIALLSGRLSLYCDRVSAAAVLSVVYTSCYIAVKSCHRKSPPLSGPVLIQAGAVFLFRIIMR